MSKGYWLVRADISDMTRFREYAAQTPEILAAFGGHFLARAGEYECVEGSTRSRNSIIEFPSYAQARACWNSPAYQAARAHRQGAGELDIVILEGIIP